MDNFNYVQTRKLTLSGAGCTSTATSIILSSLKLPDGATNITMADFGTIGHMVLEPATSKEENISFTGVTQNANGTATLTGVTRGLGFVSPYTEVAGNKFAHAGGTIAIISNSAPFYNRLLAKGNDETIEGLWDFTQMPQSSAVPATGADLINKTYADALVLGVLTTINVIVPGKAGETVSAGQLVYFDLTDNEWKLTDADTAATVNGVQLGIAQGAGTNGVAITGGVLLQGVDENQSGLVEGDVMYAGNTAGAISTTPGTTEVTVGIAKSATELYFSPRFDQQLTENQQDLLVAIEAGTDFYAASAVGTDSYAITITPAITAYATGMKFRFKADVANTGACTLAVSGLSALAIKKLNDQDLATGDIEIGQIVEVVYDGTDFQMQSQTAIAPATVDVQVFTSSGTWTKPTGALAVEVYAVGAGGGGGSGSRNASSTSGGSGGGGGSLGFKKFNASGLSATETVTIGTGGAGGASKGTAGDGNIGSVGGDTTFGTTALIVAKGGSAGLGGTAGSPAGGAGGVIGNGDIQVVGGAGGNGRNDDAAGNAGDDTASAISPRGGGAGGGFNAGSAAKNGGVGGGFITNYVKAGGAIGTIGNSSISLFYGGTGGGGSTAAGTSATGGAGINGSGGGGSGAGTTASGIGGAGGDGFVIVISYF